MSASGGPDSIVALRLQHREERGGAASSPVFAGPKKTGHDFSWPAVYFRSTESN